MGERIKGAVFTPQKKFERRNEMKKTKLAEYLTIRLDGETRRKLAELAERERRSLGQVVRLAIESYFKKGEKR